MSILERKLTDALNVLTKWRSIFAGWQLGTRAKGDPESDAVRDHREVTILLRAEVSALTKILVDKGLCTVEEFQSQLIEEAQALCAAYEGKFPGCQATETGVKIDVARALPWMRDWKR